MKAHAHIMLACCFLVSGCEEKGADASGIHSVSVEKIPRLDYRALFDRKAPWQFPEVQLGPDLQKAITQAKAHFRNIDPELMIFEGRAFGDPERGFVYLTFDRAISSKSASDPVPPPSRTDFYVVYVYKSAHNELVGYAQHPGG